MPSLISARGSITIIDLNDTQSLNVTVTSNNRPFTQIYNSEDKTFEPDWSESPYLVLTPEAYIAGTNEDVIGNVSNVGWTINGKNVTEYGGVISSQAPYQLTINENMKEASYTVIYNGLYTDPHSGIEQLIKYSLSFQRLDQSSATPFVQLFQPDGSDFRNSQPASLRAQAVFMRGGVEDTTDIAFSWYKLEASGYVKIEDGNGFSGSSTSTLTITPDAFLNVLNLKVEATDTTSGADTSGKTYINYTSFRDYTDPYDVKIESSTGSRFVNGVGSTTLRAVLWQQGSEVDADGTLFNYVWRRYDKDGVLDSTWGGDGTKEGKSINVSASEVDVKALFVVEVSKK